MSVDDLIEMLDDADPRTRRRACKALGESRDQQAVPLIIKLLERSDFSDKWWHAATFALGQIGGDAATEYLLSSLMNAIDGDADDDEFSDRTTVLRAYSHALSRTPSARVIDCMFDLLVSEDTDIRLAARNILMDNIFYGGPRFERLREIKENERTTSPEARFLFDNARRKAGINWDGSINFSESKPPRIEITTDVYFDPKNQIYWYEDEHGNKVESDNTGSPINVLDAPSSYLVYWRIENVRLAGSTPNWCHACWGSNRKNFESLFDEGDTIYFVTTDEDGYHSLFSKITLDSYLGSKEEAEDAVPFSLTSVDFATYWLAKKPWPQLFDVPFGEIALDLEFESGNKLPADFTGQNLQTPRRLRIPDVKLLDDLISVYTE